MGGTGFLGVLLAVFITMTPTPAAGTFSTTCSFETSDICGYHQDKTDELDWARARGETDDTFTGPTADHTLQTDAGYYMYLDNFTPSDPGKIARLESTQVPASPNSPICVTFWYSMYGSTMGTFNIYIKSSNGLGSPVLTRKDKTGKGWKKATVRVPPTKYASSVVFEAVLEYNTYSGIALDDVTISNTNCSHSG